MYSIPLITNFFNQFSKAKYSLELDLQARYQQEWDIEEDIMNTTSVTKQGSFEFSVILFGLMNALTTFYMMMNHSFKGILISL